MPVIINVPEALCAQTLEFLTREEIALGVASNTECEVSVVPGEGRRECTISVLYPGGWINCEAARALSGKLSLKYAEMGKLLDFYDIKVRDCALGCF